ncbi:MAG: polysaccharide deacetylase family protein [Verrucomicrobia bacterium]|nr:polysaccharide deacetylase family protein [Verrucomicrobiota bacterium]
MNLLQRICPTVLQRVPASNRSGFATVALVCLGCLSLVSLAQATTDQTITFPALPDKVLGDAPFAAGGSAIPSNLPVSYTSSNPDVATVSGSTITLHAAGTTIITAKQDGNATYNAANWVERPLHVLTFAATTAGSTRISRWKDDKTAACLLMFDDVLASRASVVVPEMKARGLRGTFYTVPNHYSSVPSFEAIWQETDVVAFGNHTWDHQALSAPRPTATAGTDYTATTGTLNWAAGDTADKTFTAARSLLSAGGP